MADSLAFICFDPETSGDDYKRFMVEQPECPFAFAIEDSSLPAGFPSDNWSRLVRGKIGRADLMIVLIGPEASASEFVTRQIEVARSVNVPFFGVYVPGIDAVETLPAGLSANRVVPCEWSRIGKAVEQLSREGKNHRFQ